MNILPDKREVDQHKFSNSEFDWLLKQDNRINSLEIEITRIRNDLDNLKDDLTDIQDYNIHKSNIGQTLLDNLFYIVLGLIISYIAHGLIYGF